MDTKELDHLLSYTSCSAMEIHTVKLLVRSFCADVNVRRSLEFYDVKALQLQDSRFDFAITPLSNSLTIYEGRNFTNWLQRRHSLK